MTNHCRHTFHGLELPVRSFSGARALRIVHPPGQLIPPHRHDWPLLTLPALGGYEEESDDGTVGIAGPAVILHPAGRCHSNCIHPFGMETFSIEFDPAWLKLDRFGALFERSSYWIGGPVPLASYGLRRLWVDAAVNERDLQRATADFLRMAKDSARSEIPPWLDSVRARIASDNAITADRLAASIGLHPRWLAHAYRQATGEGIHETILRRRVERAVDLLRGSDRPIADIAVSVGFCDQSHLNRALARFIARTPVQVRAERGSLRKLLA